MQVKAISACPDTDSMTATDDVAVVFTGLFARFYERLVRYVAARAMHDMDVAEEVAQESFVRLWEEMAVRGRVVRDPERAFGLVAQVGRWELQRYWDRRSGRMDSPAHDEELVSRVATAAPGGSSPADIIAARVNAGQIIADLPQDYRRVLALHLLEDMPLSAVAEQTGLSEPTVRATYAEGLRRLQAQMGVTPVDPAEAAREARAEAVRVYRASVAAGRPLSTSALGRMFGRSQTWALQTLRQHGGTARRSAPAWHGYRDTLRAQILAGQYAPGSLMPPTTELGARLGTSSGTMWRVLAGLCAEGVLTRQGRQIHVAQTPAAPVPAPRIPAPRRSPEDTTPARPRYWRQALTPA